MVVVEHVKLDVRPAARPPFNRVRVDGSVPPPLKDLHRLCELRLKRVVLPRVCIQLVVHRHRATVAIMEHGKGVRRLPGVKAAVPQLAQPVAIEIECRRQQHDPRDSIGMP